MNVQLGRRLKTVLGLSMAVAAAWAGGIGSALAAPVTYRAQVFTDLKLNGVSYHNASLELKFVGDTANIAVVPMPAPVASSDFQWLTVGTASFSVTAQGRTLTGTFPAGEIFVSIDTGNGGIGFGSTIGPNGLEPTYPLAFDDYTAGGFAYQYKDLSRSAELSGKAWSCMGFPMAYSTDVPLGATSCTPPDQFPLTTSLGPLVVYMPYLRTNLEGNLESMLPDGSGQYAYFGNYEGSLNRGTFSIAPN
jgi:hypothetical protein